MDYTLNDARDKLRWAIHHFEILRPQIEAFEKRDTHTFTVEADTEEGKYTIYVHGLEPTDPDWGLILGDCIHNARTALDHLMAQLYAAVTDQDPRLVKRIQFPIATERGDFRGLPGVTEAEKLPHFSGYLARMEELQPYNVHNPSVWRMVNDEGMWRPPYPIGNALDQLSKLDIIDKHRVIHAIWTGVSIIGGVTAPDCWPSEFKKIAGGASWKPLEENTEVGHWQFETPLPFDWEPSQVDMKRSFPIEVAFDKALLPQPILVMLPLYLWAVAQVLRLFEPVFAGQGPPLPVTAIQQPPGHLV